MLAQRLAGRLSPPSAPSNRQAETDNHACLASCLHPLARADSAVV